LPQSMDISISLVE